MKKGTENGIKFMTQVYLTAYQEAMALTGNPEAADDAASAVLMITSVSTSAAGKHRQEASTAEDIQQAFMAGLYAGKTSGKDEDEQSEEP